VLGKERHCSYLPRPSWHRQTGSRGRSRFSFVLSFVTFFSVILLSFGTGLDGGQREARNESPRADGGLGTDCICSSP